LEAAGAKLTFRKALLLGVACGRRLEYRRAYPATDAAFDAAERWADDALPDKERKAVHKASYAAAKPSGAGGRNNRDQPDDMKPSDASALHHAVEAARFLFESEDSAPRLAQESLWQGRESVWYSDYSHDHKKVRAEERAQCDLIREVIGNPFRK